MCAREYESKVHLKGMVHMQMKLILFNVYETLFPFLFHIVLTRNQQKKRLLQSLKRDSLGKSVLIDFHCGYLTKLNKVKRKES